MVSSAEIAIEGECRRNLAWPKTKSPSGVGFSLPRLDFLHRRAIVRSVHPIDRKPIGMTGVLLPCEIECNKQSVGDGRHHRRTAIPLDDFRVHRLTRVSNVHPKRIDRGSEFPGVAGTCPQGPPPEALRIFVLDSPSFDRLSFVLGCISTDPSSPIFCRSRWGVSAKRGVSVRGLQGRDARSPNRSPSRHVHGMASPRSLFGGAMSTVLPARLGDISDVRPVPDHQEIFADAERDQSVVVELLEAQDATDEQTLQIFFRDLVQLNGGTHARVEHVEKLQRVPNLPEAAYTGVLEGHMLAAKHEEGPTAANRVHLLLALVRLPRAKTDVLITLNTPLEISMNSSSAAATNGHLPTADTAVEEARRIVVQAIDTLQVSDWGLFGP